jgi:hypothetical protein
MDQLEHRRLLKAARAKDKTSTISPSVIEHIHQGEYMETSD